MRDFVPAFVVIIIGVALAGVHASRTPRAEARLFILSFAAHIFSAFSQVWIIRSLYGGGDILGYTAWGDLLATALRADFNQFAPEITKLFFHLPAVIPADIPGAGSSTGSMAAVAGVLSLVTGGSVYTLCLSVAVIAYFGQIALYQAFRDAFGPEHRLRLLAAALLIPSEVFWSSAVLKESMAVAGFGFLMLGLERTLLRRVRLGGLVTIALGAVLVAMLKAYILIATTAAIAAAVYYRSGRGRAKLGKPVQLVMAVGIALGCYMALMEVEPQYSLENFADQAAMYQAQGQEFTGGSTYSMGDSSRTLTGQLIFAPLALFTSVFRPLLIEAKSPLIFVNALETTAALFLFVRALSRRGIRNTWAFLTGNAMLMFCLVFVVVFGTGVGLTTTNLGSLSRYRMPLVPFLWALLLTLDARQPRTVKDGAAHRVPDLRQAWRTARRT